jgi:hypothetical protein
LAGNEVVVSRAWGQIAMGAFMMGCFCLGLYLQRNRIPLSPRQVRKQSRWTLALMIPLCLLMIPAFLNSSFARDKWYMAVDVACLVAFVASLIYQGLRPSTEGDTIANFASDTTHCGRCEYDLTGNTSGICPECGWIIPQGALDVDSPGWALWWRKWQIDHLRRWRVTLGMLLLNFLLFAGVAVAEAIYLKNLASVMMLGIMVILIAINILRVVRYGLNEARRHAQRGHGAVSGEE